MRGLYRYKKKYFDNATELLIKTDLIDYKIKKDKNGDWIPYDEEYTLKIRNNKVNARWN